MHNAREDKFKTEYIDSQPVALSVEPFAGITLALVACCRAANYNVEFETTGSTYISKSYPKHNSKCMPSTIHFQLVPFNPDLIND